MKRSWLEPEVIPVFRLFVGLRLAVHGLTLCLWLISPDLRQQQLPFLGMAETTFLLTYLSLRWLRDLLGRAYLPVALFIASAGPIIEYAFTLAFRRLQGAPATGEEAVLIILALLIPLLLVSWQYNFFVLLAFCVGTALLDLTLAVPLARAGGPPLRNVFLLVVLRSALFLAVGSVIVWLMSAQRRQRRELAEANRKLARYAATLEQLTISRERNRLARELHDTLAHTLSALAVQLEAAASLWNSDPSRARAMLDQSLGMTREGLVEARRAIQSLRAAPLEDLGLALAVTHLAESVAARAGLILDRFVPDRIDSLPPETAQAIYRIADEALNNVARHAGARRITLHLNRQASGQVRLLVADDGQGFDMSAALDDGHYGLKGLRERAELVGGRLAVESKLGKGTQIEFVVEAGQ